MTAAPVPPALVQHQPEQHRFQLDCPGGPAELTYVLTDGGVTMAHTLVPTQAEGTGVGSALTRAALDWAIDRDLEVDPQCWFVAGWLDRHPEVPVRRAPAKEAP